MFSAKPLVFLAKMIHNSPTTHAPLATDFRDRRGEQCKPPTFAPATKRFRAIDLSCRARDACGAGAGCWAWIPGGGLHSAQFHPPPPTLRYVVLHCNALYCNTWQYGAPMYNPMYCVVVWRVVVQRDVPPRNVRSCITGNRRIS